MTKTEVLTELLKNTDEFLSGAELAKRLSLSRTAVWKAVEQLKSDGYKIESVTRRGYRLMSESDVLSEAGVRKYLTDSRLCPVVYDTISSTNTVLKAKAADGAAEGLCLISGEQTAGRGRMGRSFYSPSGSGVYMSVLLRPHMSAYDATRITAAAAVAAAETVEEIVGVKADIKWVNDIYVGGRKVCGILTEAAMDFESGLVSYVIVGIGINTRIPEGDFPEEIRSVAGALTGNGGIPELRCRIAAGVLQRLMKEYDSLGSEECYEKYRSRSLVTGKDINILSPGREPIAARAVDIDRDFALLAELPNGSIMKISSGEVSIRLK